MTVLAGQSIAFVRGVAFSQAFTCSLADLLGPGYPPATVEAFAIEGATASVSFGRRGDLRFRTECAATATVAGNVVTLAVSSSETASILRGYGYFTIDVSNYIERWPVVEGLWTAT